jgi:hypothetical protein
MGSTNSTVTQEATNTAITNFTLDVAKECSAGASNNIVFKSENVKGDVIMSGNKFDQSATVNFTCLQQATSEADLQAKFSTFMDQNSKVEGSPFAFLSSTNSTQNIKLKNEVISNLKMTDLQKCAAAASNSFIKEAKNVDGNFIVENNTINQAAEVISQCKQVSDMAAAMATTINNELKQENDTEAGSIFGGMFGNIFGDMGGMGSMLIGLLVCCCCCCCCFLLLGGGGFALYQSQGDSGQEAGGRYSKGISTFLNLLIRKLKMALK